MRRPTIQGALFTTAFSFAVILLLAPGAQAGPCPLCKSNYHVLYNFNGPNGAYPIDAGAISIDSVGNLYGTTYSGGACGQGTLFQLSPSGGGAWSETVLHSFCGGQNDGASPYGAPYYDPVSGFVWYTTAYGGQDDEGYFGVYPPNPLAEYPFCVFAACIPLAGPNIISTNFGGGFSERSQFGSSYSGGANGQGGLWVAGWIESYDFCSLPGCADGANPAGPVTFDSSYDPPQSPITLYGMTSMGGAANQGVVYECVSQTTNSFLCSPMTVLHSFVGGSGDGSYPFYAGLNRGSHIYSGKSYPVLYGTTPQGGGTGCYSGCGVAFALSEWPGSRGGVSWRYSLLHHFAGGGDGATPYSGLTSLNGLLYGTTNLGGSGSGYGTIYSIDPNSGNETILYSFSGGSDGAYPYSGLVADANGNLYGVAYEGGAYGYGLVFEITP